MLRELNDLSLVQLTQKRWFDREMNTVAKQITYLGGRKNQEKHMKAKKNSPGKAATCYASMVSQCEVLKEVLSDAIDIAI